MVEDQAAADRSESRVQYTLTEIEMMRLACMTLYYINRPGSKEDPATRDHWVENTLQTYIAARVDPTELVVYAADLIKTVREHEKKQIELRAKEQPRNDFLTFLKKLFTKS